jgi:APA family basic amino acid/polyamine antiporter
MKNSLNNQKLIREIGLFSAIILVIANMVGTGIFTTSGFILKELEDPLTLLICWLVGGAFALCGALCYGELGARYPKAGGEYVFLREAFGKCIGFLSGWISLIVGFSAPIAAASIAFAVYLFRALSIPASDSSGTIFGGILVLSPQSLVAVLVVLALSTLHYHSLKVGSRVQNLLTIFKVVFIVIFISLGLLSEQGAGKALPMNLAWSKIFDDQFAVSLIFVSFAYSGWNAAAYLGGEIKRPQRNIPIALFVGTFFVMGLYLLLNLVYVHALSVDQMAGAMDVGALAAMGLFGEKISRYFSLAIAIGLLSVVSAMIMAGPRVYYAMAKDGVFFPLFAKVSKRHHTPAHSIFLQAGIAIFMIITASYDKLLLYIGFTLSLCAMLTVIGLMVIRIRIPQAKIPYSAIGYPLTPILFILGNLWIVYFSIKSRPVPALFGMVTIGIGLAVYFWFERKQPHTMIIRKKSRTPAGLNQAEEARSNPAQQTP